MAAELRALLIVLIALPCVCAGGWKNAHATFYGTPDGTIGGGCGYEDYKSTYGPYTAALSTALFNNAGSCGGCYEIRCVNSTGYCKPSRNTIVVTATDFCPPNYALPSNNGGWCNPPNEHFDLSQPAFLQLAEYKAGYIPVQYRRVPCKRNGGAKFTISGNPFFNLVTVTNVGGAGDIAKVEVKVDGKGKWTPLKRNWGEKWETSEKLSGAGLTFRVTTSDGRVLTSRNVAPKSWQYGQTFLGVNF